VPAAWRSAGAPASAPAAKGIASDAWRAHQRTPQIAAKLHLRSPHSSEEFQPQWAVCRRIRLMTTVSGMGDPIYWMTLFAVRFIQDPSLAGEAE